MRWLLPLICAGCSQVISFEPVTYREVDGGAILDAGNDASTSTCPSGATCQDFSSAITAPWKLDDNSGAAQVMVKSGALDIAIPTAGIGSGLIAFTGTPLASGSKLFLRFRASVGQSLANASLVDVRHADRAKSGGVSLKISDGKLAYNVTSAARDPTASQVGMKVLPIGTFMCIVLALDIGAAGHVTASIDGGKPELDQAADTLVGETAWDAVWIGLPFVDAPPGGASVTIDDIAISQTSLSCN